MKLIDVYSHDGAEAILWDLLFERDPATSISHSSMPTFEEHVAFVRSRPYLHWYLIDMRTSIVGATYLSKQREIGIFIFNAYQRCGYGPRAVELLMAKHPGTFLANVNPNNVRSVRMFVRLGFRILQHTYAKP